MWRLRKIEKPIISGKNDEAFSHEEGNIAQSSFEGGN